MDPINATLAYLKNNPKKVAWLYNGSLAWANSGVNKHLLRLMAKFHELGVHGPLERIVRQYSTEELSKQAGLLVDKVYTIDTVEAAKLDSYATQLGVEFAQGATAAAKRARLKVVAEQKLSVLATQLDVKFAEHATADDKKLALDKAINSRYISDAQKIADFKNELKGNDAAALAGQCIPLQVNAADVFEAGDSLKQKRKKLVAVYERRLKTAYSARRQALIADVLQGLDAGEQANKNFLKVVHAIGVSDGAEYDASAIGNLSDWSVLKSLSSAGEHSIALNAEFKKRFSDQGLVQRLRNVVDRGDTQLNLRFQWLFLFVKELESLSADTQQRLIDCLFDKALEGDALNQAMNRFARVAVAASRLNAILPVEPRKDCCAAQLFNVNQKTRFVKDAFALMQQNQAFFKNEADAKKLKQHMNRFAREHELACRIEVAMNIATSTEYGHGNQHKVYEFREQTGYSEAKLQLKQRDRARKKWATGVAAVIAGVVGVGEAMVAMAFFATFAGPIVAGMAVIGVGAALVNVFLINRSASKTLKDIFTGRVFLDESGKPLSTGRKFAIGAGLGLALGAGTCYGFLSAASGSAAFTLFGIGGAAAAIFPPAIAIITAVAIFTLFAVAFKQVFTVEYCKSVVNDVKRWWGEINEDAAQINGKGKQFAYKAVCVAGRVLAYAIVGALTAAVLAIGIPVFGPKVAAKIGVAAGHVATWLTTVANAIFMSQSISSFASYTFDQTADLFGLSWQSMSNSWNNITRGFSQSSVPAKIGKALFVIPLAAVASYVVKPVATAVATIVTPLAMVAGLAVAACLSPFALAASAFIGKTAFKPYSAFRPSNFVKATSVVRKWVGSALDWVARKVSCSSKPQSVQQKVAKVDTAEGVEAVVPADSDNPLRSALVDQAVVTRGVAMTAMAINGLGQAASGTQHDTVRSVAELPGLHGHDATAEVLGVTGAMFGSNGANTEAVQASTGNTAAQLRSGYEAAKGIFKDHCEYDLNKTVDPALNPRFVRHPAKPNTRVYGARVAHVDTFVLRKGDKLLTRDQDHVTTKFGKRRDTRMVETVVAAPEAPCSERYSLFKAKGKVAADRVVAGARQEFLGSKPGLGVFNRYVEARHAAAKPEKRSADLFAVNEEVVAVPASV